jgi:hypothetical protein
MGRGDRREAIFYDDADRVEFLRTLGQACLKSDRLRIGSASYVSNYSPLSIVSPDSYPLLYFRDLCFLEQKKLLHTHVFPGNGSMVVGNSSAPAPRGIVFLNSFSCARALS